MPVTHSSLLEVWEHALGLAPAARPVALLSLMLPEADAESLAKLPLGLRDAHLLRIRQALFGDRIECLTRCPACGDQMEFVVCAGDLLQQADETEAADHWLAGTDHGIRFRMPNSDDILALAGLPSSTEEFQLRLLSRCIISVETSQPEAISHIPAELIDRVTNEIARRDPLAVIWLDLGCAQCGHMWKGLFEIASTLWADVDQWARTILHQVHLLARAYGWAERDILQMSASRREIYLGMAGS